MNLIFICLFVSVWANESGQRSETTLTEFEDVFRVSSEDRLGPWETVPVDDPMVQKYVEKAVERQNKEFGDHYKRLMSIDQAKKQFISGYKFEIKMTIRETECRKNDPNKDKCKINSARAPEPITFDVWANKKSQHCV